VSDSAEMTRAADISRATAETDVRLTLALDGRGDGNRQTGVGFFDHLLDALAKHGRLDLDVEARGDLETGAHHTVEDTGIALGQALDRALGDRAGIARFGQATVPMDEALVTCAVDVSGRPFALVRGRLPEAAVAGFDAGLLEEFVRAVASGARLTVHLRIEDGANAHHVIEAAFKAFARALRGATTLDPSEPGVPSTKGLL
jgi:imidazoleglycerol-phosphate dehydratase